MKNLYKKFLNKFTYTVCSILITISVAQASTVHLKSDESADVDITIEGGDGNLITESKEAIRLILKSGEEKTVEVKKSQIGKETFTVIGKVRMPSLYNKCGPLLVNKNYRIIFTGSKTGGTICISEPLN